MLRFFWVLLPLLTDGSVWQPQIFQHSYISSKWCICSYAGKQGHRGQNSLFHQMKRNLEGFRFLTERCISLQIAYIYQAFVFLWISLYLLSLYSPAIRCISCQSKPVSHKMQVPFLSFEKIPKCKCRDLHGRF